MVRVAAAAPARDPRQRQRAPRPRGLARLDDDGADAVAEQQPAPSGAERAHLAVGSEHPAGVEQGELVGFDQVTARDDDAVGPAAGDGGGRVADRAAGRHAGRHVAAQVLLGQAAGVGGGGGECLGPERRAWPPAARGAAGSPWMARNSGVRARSAADRPASSHASRTARATSASSCGLPAMAAAEPTRRALTSNRWTGAKAGRPDSTPDSRVSVPGPYALSTAVPVTTTWPVPRG